MVCLKQLSLTAVVALSLSETGLAAPIHAPIDERALEDRALKNVLSAIGRNKGEKLGRVVGAVGAAAAIKTAFFPQPQQRSLEHIEERAVKGQRLKSVMSALNKNKGERFDRVMNAVSTAADFKNAFFPQPQQRSLEHLNDRAVKGQKLKSVVSALNKNKGARFDRVMNTVTAVADFKNAFFPQPQQRSLESLENRAVKGQRLKSVMSALNKNKGERFDRVMNAVSTAADFKTAFFPQPQQPKQRSIEELEQRAFEDYIRERYF
ncbi:unnamed protein product [Clonostachys rosea]|uniref:Uncharacterized protein n=1 Tax=Bionectria ochroleuca TaxID=29856 RepID=A0ABY6UIA1_BIOOC|nr:unnamed protein product [Clonostachys rosea]